MYRYLLYISVMTLLSCKSVGSGTSRVAGEQVDRDLTTLDNRYEKTRSRALNFQEFVSENKVSRYVYFDTDRLEGWSGIVGNLNSTEAKYYKGFLDAVKKTADSLYSVLEPASVNEDIFLEVFIRYTFHSKGEEGIFDTIAKEQRKTWPKLPLQEFLDKYAFFRNFRDMPHRLLLLNKISQNPDQMQYLLAFRFKYSPEGKGEKQIAKFKVQDTRDINTDI